MSPFILYFIICNQQIIFNGQKSKSSHHIHTFFNFLPAALNRWLGWCGDVSEKWRELFNHGLTPDHRFEPI
jgi:hypothetical protein